MDGRVSKILLVDDQVLYREALRSLIERWDDFQVVAEASDGVQAIEFVSLYQPDLILMDVRMPGMDGITAAQAILSKSPDMPIVMLTVESEKSLVFDALQIGVRGYLLKDTPARKLRDRLRSVINGEATLSESVTASVLNEFSKMRISNAVKDTKAEDKAFQNLVSSLSARDKDILRLLAQGNSNEQIASELYLSLGTVKKRISQLMIRLGFENRVQIAVFAVKIGLS